MEGGQKKGTGTVFQPRGQGNIIKEGRYTYDVEDRRIGVWEDADGAGAGEPFQRWTAYDGLNPWADFDGNGSLTTRYLYGPAIDQLFARYANGEVDWYLGDYLGSVRQIAKTDGAVLDNITYDGFGQILSESNPENGDRFKFTGREYDALFAQYYYRARYYGADVGRFISEDPINFEGGDTNFFRYGNNSPVNNVDPEGLRWVDTGRRVLAVRTGVRGFWRRGNWVGPTLRSRGYWRERIFVRRPTGREGVFDFSPPRHPLWPRFQYRLDGNVQNLQVEGLWDDPPIRWAFEQVWVDDQNPGPVPVPVPEGEPRLIPIEEWPDVQLNRRQREIVTGVGVGTGIITVIWILWQGTRFIPGPHLPVRWCLP